MQILLSAFHDGSALVPVQMEVREYKPGTVLENKLHVTVALKKEEAGISLRGSGASAVPVSIRGTPASMVTLTDIITNVKDDTGDLVKYLSDSLLNLNQRVAKHDALERERVKPTDMKYEYAVEKGMTERAANMIAKKL